MDTQPKSKILLIDDDTSLLVTLSDFLRFEGYEVVTADSGEQGLRRLESMTPDLIILDMSMPGMGGIGFLREVSDAAGKPRFPILVLTARANMAEFFANVDVDGFVAKPCNPEDLLMEVHRIVFLRKGEAERAKNSRSPRNKVLIGEDDPAIQSALVEAFTEAGFLVVAVEKGPSVLERAIVDRPQLVVVKRVLRSMNGDAIANMLRDMPNTQTIPVVLYDETDSPTAWGGLHGDFEGALRRFVRGNNSRDLIAAARGLLGL